MDKYIFYNRLERKLRYVDLVHGKCGCQVELIIYIFHIAEALYVQVLLCQFQFLLQRNDELSF